MHNLKLFELQYHTPFVALSKDHTRYWICIGGQRSRTWCLRPIYSPSGHDGPLPSGGSGEQPQGSAECNDCMQTPGGVG